MKNSIADVKRPMNRRQFLSWSAGLGGGLFLSQFLPGCNSKDSKDAAALSGPQSRKLIMATAVDLYTLDPAVGFDTAISSTLKGLYDALFRHVGNPPRAIPWLVDKYSVSKDAREWTFTLFENAVFHDGTPVTSEAVVYSLERLLKINKGPAGLFSGLLKPGNARVIDRHTFKIHLTQPFGSFLHTLTWLFVLNPRIVQAHAEKDYGQTWLKDHEAGSGPFTIAEWKPGEKYVFKALPEYWKGWPSKEHLLEYERRVIRENMDRIKALENREAGMVDWIMPAEQNRLKSKGFRIIQEPSIETYEIKLNNRKGYTADMHVRKAVSYAFDYTALLKIWDNRAVSAEGPLPPGLGCSRKDLKLYSLDPQKAKQELSQSPWPAGGFALDYVYVAGLEEERKTGELFRDSLAVLNIKVHIIPMAWADAVGTFKNPKTSPALFPLYSSSAYPDPDNYLWSGYHSSQAGEWTNPGHFQNTQMDHWLEKARATMNPEERTQLYCQAQQKALAEAASVFGVCALDHHVFSPRIQNLVYCPAMGSDEDFYFLHLAAG